MNPILIERSRVSQNHTICLTKPIREALGIKPGDSVILSLMEDGTVRTMKGANSLEDLAGAFKDTFAELGGGEAFLKAERASWED